MRSLPGSTYNVKVETPSGPFYLTINRGSAASRRRFFRVLKEEVRAGNWWGLVICRRAGVWA